MPRYKVISNITMDHVGYEPGSEIDLTEEQAASMPWAVELSGSEKDLPDYAEMPLAVEASANPDQEASDTIAAPAPTEVKKTGKGKKRR